MEIKDEIKIDSLIRSRRRSIALMISSDARLVVRAPHFTPLNEIKMLVLEKRSWIRRKQDLWRRRNQAVFPKKFIEGERFLFMGKTYGLEIVETCDTPVVLEESLKLSKKASESARAVLTRWYKEQAFKEISDRAAWYAKTYGLAYKSLRVNCAKKRWGSCGPYRSLNFSWRLIMAPPSILDYVIAHELSHLVEKNHSRRFWDKVREMIPDYEASRHWLKENGHVLVI